MTILIKLAQKILRVLLCVVFLKRQSIFNNTIYKKSILIKRAFHFNVLLKFVPKQIINDSHLPIKYDLFHFLSHYLVKQKFYIKWIILETFLLTFFCQTYWWLLNFVNVHQDNLMTDDGCGNIAQYMSRSELYLLFLYLSMLIDRNYILHSKELSSEIDE